MVSDKKISSDELIKIAHLAWSKIIASLRKDGVKQSLVTEPLIIASKKISNFAYPFISVFGRGCAHHLNGGCTMCSYMIRSEKNSYSANQIKKQIDQAIIFYKNLNLGNNESYCFGFGSGGSFWDPTEFPPHLRIYLYKRIKEITSKRLKGQFSFESRLEYVNIDLIKEVRSCLGENFAITLGYGIESMNRVVREACINKRLPVDWKKKIELLRENKIIAKAHLIVKPIFLTEEEAIDDIITSVNLINEKNYADNIVIMTMSIRKFTIVNYLYKQGEYAMPNMWSIIKIIKSLGPLTCKKINFNGFAWTKKQYDSVYPSAKNPDASGLVRGCNECSPILIPMLLDFKRPNYQEWNILIKTAEEINCSCKNEYLKTRSESPLYENFNSRILENIEKLSLSITNKSLSELIESKKL